MTKCQQNFNFIEDVFPSPRNVIVAPRRLKLLIIFFEKCTPAYTTWQQTGLITHSTQDDHQKYPAFQKQGWATKHSC